MEHYIATYAENDQDEQKNWEELEQSGILNSIVLHSRQRSCATFGFSASKQSLEKVDAFLQGHHFGSVEMDNVDMQTLD